MTRPNSITTIDAGTGEALAVAGGAYRILVPGSATSGACSIIEMNLPPGGGPGPHAHKTVNESFYVLEGEVVFRSETQTYHARKGDFVNIPLGGAIHNFKNESTAMARLLCVVSPSGIDELFREIGKPLAEGEAPTPPPSAPPTPEAVVRMKALAEKYDQEFFPPDYFSK